VTAYQANTDFRGMTKLQQLGRLTYHFPINHSSRYYRPVALDPAFRIREGFGGRRCGSREDKMAAIMNEPLSRHALAFVLAGGRGSRLLELTDRRAKPAVYFGENRASSILPSPTR